MLEAPVAGCAPDMLTTCAWILGLDSLSERYLGSSGLDATLDSSAASVSSAPSAPGCEDRSARHWAMWYSASGEASGAGSEPWASSARS